MKTRAVIFEEPQRIALAELELDAPGDADVVVDVLWSGISTGTERLLHTGRMPAFPGMGYPLVPGYETVGTIVSAGDKSGRCPGERVFVPGARCYGEVRGLFGGAASRLVVPGARTTPVNPALGEQAVLLALAATAYHALTVGSPPPELIVGHGVLGRLLARIAVVGGASPTVWEANPARRAGAAGYTVIAPEDDTRRDYRSICDVSGDAALLDTLVGRLAPRGEIVLAGFYDARLSFAFAPAFMREARLLTAAEWKPADLEAVISLVDRGRLSLDGLLTHRFAADAAGEAYKTAFGDAGCLKSILDWRTIQ